MHATLEEVFRAIRQAADNDSSGHGSFHHRQYEFHELAARLIADGVTEDMLGRASNEQKGIPDPYIVQIRGCYRSVQSGHTRMKFDPLPKERRVWLRKSILSALVLCGYGARKLIDEYVRKACGGVGFRPSKKQIDQEIDHYLRIGTIQLVPLEDQDSRYEIC